MFETLTDRFIRRALFAIAIAGLVAGLAAWFAGQDGLAARLWAAGTIPVVIGLGVSIWQDFAAGRMGVDAVAFISMSVALLLGENLAAAVVAVMYAGGNLLEDFAVVRAERDLKTLIDRAPRIAHRIIDSTVEDIPVDQVAAGDQILVRAGEVIPIDGLLLTDGAMIDEAALTGEPIPVSRPVGDPVFSGTINAGDTFEMRATATAGDSTYAAIVKLVTAAQTAKAPFIRLADRYALLLLPVTLLLAGAAWLLSGDEIRGLAVLVASTPCPLILAAPVALIAGVSRAARLGILIKGGAPLEALAKTSHGDVRQNRNAHGRRRAPRGDRDGARRGGRYGLALCRVPGTGLAPCRGRCHCVRRPSAPPDPRSSNVRPRDDGLGTGRNCREAQGPCRFLRSNLRTGLP